ELAAVGRIGEDLLVAGDRRVEDHLAHGSAARADRAAAKHRPVGEDEKRCVLAGHLWKPDAKSGKGFAPFPLPCGRHYTGASAGPARRTCRRALALCRAAIS